jgi:hypothetical protein
VLLALLPMSPVVEVCVHGCVDQLGQVAEHPTVPAEIVQKAPHVRLPGWVASMNGCSEVCGCDG